MLENYVILEEKEVFHFAIRLLIHDTLSFNLYTVKDIIQRFCNFNEPSLFCSYIKKLTYSKRPLFDRMLSYIGGRFLILNVGLLSVTGSMYLLSITFFVNMMSIFPVLGSYKEKGKMRDTLKSINLP